MRIIHDLLSDKPDAVSEDARVAGIEARTKRDGIEAGHFVFHNIIKKDPEMLRRYGDGQLRDDLHSDLNKSAMLGSLKNVEEAGLTDKVRRDPKWFMALANKAKRYMVEGIDEAYADHDRDDFTADPSDFDDSESS